MREMLTTDRLTLRPLKPEDAGPISLYAGDLKVARMVTRVPHPYPPGAAEAFIERTLSGRMEASVYAIELADVDWGDLVGVIELRPHGEVGERRLGYWLGAPAWGRGLATEAVQAIVAEAFADTEVAVITSDVFLDNPASRRVLEKAGFEFGEEFEQICPARGEAVRAQRCALERAAWRAAMDAALR